MYKLDIELPDGSVETFGEFTKLEYAGMVFDEIEDKAKKHLGDGFRRHAETVDGVKKGWVSLDLNIYNAEELYKVVKIIQIKEK